MAGLTTIAGTGAPASTGDGGPAVEAAIDRPAALAVAPDGSIFVAESARGAQGRPGRCHHDGRRHRDGRLLGRRRAGRRGAARGPDGSSRSTSAATCTSPIAGTTSFERSARTASSERWPGRARPGSSGDDGPATAAELRSPFDITVDGSANLYISDSGNHRIRRVDPAGVISTVVGVGRAGSGGDGGLAIVAELDSPAGIDLDADGNLYIVDAGNGRIRWALAN